MQKTDQSRTIRVQEDQPLTAQADRSFTTQANRTFTAQAENDHPLTLQMVTLMLPLIMGNILQQLYNTIDAAVIGHFAGQQDFAAVGVAGTVMNLFLFAIAGACTGISILFAQLYGAGRIDRLRQEHFIALSTGLVFSVILACTGLLANRPLLRLLQTPEELLPCTHHYLSIILLALPASFLYNLYSALFRAVGKTSLPMLVLAFSTVLNLFLDLLMVAVLGMGAGGAAIATSLAQLFSAGACLLFLYRSTPFLCLQRGDCRMDLPLLHKTLKLSFVTGFHQCALYLGKMMVQGAVNTGGTSLITAFTASARIEGFANSFGDSGCAATSILIAQSFGAGNKERIKKCFRVSLRLLAAVGIGMGLLMAVLASPLTVLITGTADPAVLSQAVGYLRIISAFYVFCFTGNTFAGYFDGIGHVAVPFAGAASHITLRVILSWILISRFRLPAIAVATGLGWVWANTFWTLVRHRSEGGSKPRPISHLSVHSRRSALHIH